MLSLEDRLAIDDLYARYCLCRDLGDIEGWANCFTEDAIFVAGPELRGRAAIAASRAPGATPPEPYQFIQHWPCNLVVRGDGRKASAASYLLRIAKDEAGSKIITQVFCEDRLEKVNGEWLLAYRKAHFDKPGADIIPRPGKA